MSAPTPSRRSVRRCTRDSDHAKMALDLDLNNLPVVEDQVPEEALITMPLLANQEGTGPVDAEVGCSIVQHQVFLTLRTADDGGLSSPIDVEAIEEEVEFLSSPRDFPQARNRPRWNHPERVSVQDVLECEPGQAVDTELTISLYGCNKRARDALHDKSENGEYLDNLGDVNKKRSDSMNPELEPKEMKSKEPPEPTFNCPVCLQRIVDASSTICGHIFCQNCIKETVRKLKKCPSCRRKLTRSSYHRLYFPTSG